ncbi:MAG: hypothetical protein R3281_01510 [Balneolaceae bacterium]|nr:hypothetical protein [Balneolaceae bacterium]
MAKNREMPSGSSRLPIWDFVLALSVDLLRAARNGSGLAGS